MIQFINGSNQAKPESNTKRLSRFRRPSNEVVKKSIVFCFDGTGAEFGERPYTNVLELFKMLEKDSLNQYCYYQPGIGVEFGTETHDFFDKGFLNSKYHKVLNTIDAMVAFTLEQHVVAAYSYLCQIYNHGDKVYLFGFSRGSFTARVLTGLIERVGLLNKGLGYMTRTAWEMYSNWEYAGQPVPDDPKVTMIEEFTATFTRNKFEIEFMGLWDSVSSVGLVIDKLFPFATTTSIVKHVRHALSIDERRAKFKQLMIQTYHDPDCQDLIKSNGNNSETTSIETIASDLLRTILNPRLRNTKPITKCSKDVIEMFFPGDHSDVGGGWPSDIDGGSISDISLRWILSEAIQYGVLFKPGSIGKFNSEKPILSSLLSYHHDVLSFLPSKPESNEIVNIIPNHAIDRFNARGSYSILGTLSWWATELLPIQFKFEDENGEWKRGFEPNLGKHRIIPKACLLHWSLFYRLHYVKDYEPNANICPKTFGEHMLDSLQPFKGLYKGQLLEKYCNSLTKDEIKSDFDNEIWTIIPNELQMCLDKDPKL